MSNTTMSTKSKAAALAAVQALMAGTLKHFPNGSFTLGNAAYTTVTLVALLKSVADAITALNTAEVAAKHALTTLQGVLAQADPVIRIYRRFLHATFANTAPALADFSLAPPKVPAPRTSEEKAASAAKAKATRVARGTASKKSKLAVKGNVTGVTVTPITAPSAAPPAAPVTPVTPAPPAAPVIPVTPASPSAQPAPTAPSVPITGSATK